MIIKNDKNEKLLIYVEDIDRYFYLKSGETFKVAGKYKIFKEYDTKLKEIFKVKKL